MKKITSIDLRIAKKVTHKRNCLIWNGHLRKGKHPMIYKGTTKGYRESINVRRYLYQKEYGDIKNGTHVKPKCGNLNCVSPKCAISFDPKIDAGKLNAKQKAEIKKRWELYLKHKTTMQALANEFGVSKQAIDQIVKRRYTGKKHSTQPPRKG